MKKTDQFPNTAKILHDISDFSETNGKFTNIIQIDNNHSVIHKGYSYEYNKWVELGNNGVQTLYLFTKDHDLHFGHDIIFQNHNGTI